VSSKNTTLKIVKSFIRENYLNQYACMVSGSYVEGKNNQYSDIDILIFVNDRNTVFNETLPFEKLKIQPIIIPIQNVQEILWVDYITCKGAFINIISKGEIIFDNSNFLKHLIPHTKNLETLGGRPLSNADIHKFRVKISSLLYDVMGGENLDELVFPINTILDLTSEFKLKISGNWCGDGKYRMRHLKALDNKFYVKLIESINEFYVLKSKKKIINLISKVLNSHGGLLPFYSKEKTLSRVTSKYLVIEINTENKLNKEKIKKTILTLVNLFDKKTSKKLKYYFFLSKQVEVNKIEQNIYMIVEADNNYINDYLIAHLNLLVSNTHGLSELLFPFQFDPKSRFSNEEIYNSVSPIFFNISKLVIKTNNALFNQAFQLRFSLTLFKEIKHHWFENNSNTFISFLDYLIKCWIVFSYDDGTSCTTSTLIKNKQNVLAKFEVMYLQQREDLLKTYNKTCSIENDFFKILRITNNVTNFEDIPTYKTYLLNINELEAKKWSLYKEVIFRILSIILVDNRLTTYIPFVIKKIENND